MNPETSLHALCTLRPRITALRLRMLLTRAGSAAAAWNAEPSLLREAGWTEEAISWFVEHRTRWSATDEAERFARSGIRLVGLEDEDFPALLRQLFDPPIGLYVLGELRGTDPALAFVGSRKATPYGRLATQALVRPLAVRGLTIVSGLAYGIDAEAHRATLGVHGHTIAVLGGGIDDASLYPRAHRQLAAEIVAAGGAVVSEFPPGTSVRAEFFPQRNRIIAGLARGVVVVEAGRESGALITARCALAENREVFAVPGSIVSPLSEGTNHLIAEGASPALTAESILENFALAEVFQTRRETARTTPPATRGVPLPDHPARAPSPVADAILSQLATEPRDIDALVAACTLPAQEVSAMLSLLELEGRVREVGGKQYVRC